MSSSGSPPISCGWLDVASRGGLSPVSFSSKDGKKYILRQMKAADYPSVCTLLPLVSRGEQQLSPEALAAVLQQPCYFPFCCFAAAADPQQQPEEEGELCGFCEVYVQPHLRRAADGRLERVVVTPAFRGRGVATAMCAALLQLVKQQLQLGRLDLTVEKADARHIYTKLGFQPDKKK
ncbi:hypothetical protein Efla_002857 [Eimeria flavescens]